MEKKIRIGGQAVIEGVMVKGENCYAVSVRKGKEIVHKEEKLKKRSSKFFRLPFVRGFFSLFDMLVIGMNSLMWSAGQNESGEGSLTKKEIFLTLLFSAFAVILFFVMLPYFATAFFGFKEEESPLLFNLVDGLIRIALFLGYVWVISMMKDIKRIFQYHGAEHMAIHCHEEGLELSISNIRKFQTMHPRCGTSFLLFVLLISILVFSFVPSIVNLLFPLFISLNSIIKKIMLFAVRILMMPAIAGISYEVLKISDKFRKNIFFRAVSYPGILLQKITTAQPSDEQIEVAINSVKKVVEMERKARF